MSLAATYVSQSCFTVAGDETDAFVPGRAIKADCGVDGNQYGHVNYSVYTTLTTVYLITPESDNMTSNMVSVDFSTFKPDSLNTGNDDLRNLLMLRGFKNGFAISYKDADEVYINPGAIHIDDGTYERVYKINEQLIKQLTSLSASTWYALYVKPPANGLVITTSEIEYSSTMPSEDTFKLGWYHPTNASWRCIGWIYSNASSQITLFYVTSGYYALVDWLNVLPWASGNINPALDVLLWIPIGSLVAVVGVEFDKYSSDGDTRVGTKGSLGYYTGYVDTATPRTVTEVTVKADSSKYITLVSNVRVSGFLDLRGFLLPQGIA